MLYPLSYEGRHDDMRRDRSALCQVSAYDAGVPPARLVGCGRALPAADTLNPMPELIYRRNAVRPRILLLSAIAWVLFVVALVTLLLGGIDVVAGIVIAVVLGIVGAVSIWMIVMMQNFGRIRLSTAALRVGRGGSVPVANLDPGWVRMLASHTSAPLRERVEGSPGPVAMETVIPDGPTLGGPLAHMKEFSVVTLRLRDRTAVKVATDDEAGLIEGLLTAVGS